MMTESRQHDYVTHDPRMAEFADPVIELHDGKLLNQ